MTARAVHPGLVRAYAGFSCFGMVLIGISAWNELRWLCLVASSLGGAVLFAAGWVLKRNVYVEVSNGFLRSPPFGERAIAIQGATVRQLGFPLAFPVVTSSSGQRRPLLAVSPIWDVLAARDEATEFVLEKLGL